MSYRTLALAAACGAALSACVVAPVGRPYGAYGPAYAPAAADDAIRKALAPTPGDRFPTAADFGHALEAGCGFSDRLLHGEAVALGMALAFGFSARKKLIAPAEAERARAHLAAVGLPTHIKDIAGGAPGVDELMDLIAQDKKVKRGKLTFILVRGIGQAFVANDVDASEVRSFLAEQYR